VRFTITENGDTQTFVIPIGGLLLIDPQGVVYDRVAYDQAIAAGRTPEEARAQAAITGATVRLQRRNPDGGFANVLSGDPGITPNINPQVTGANGLFQWDVAPPACYRVSVEAPGFVAPREPRGHDPAARSRPARVRWSASPRPAPTRVPAPAAPAPAPAPTPAGFTPAPTPRAALLSACPLGARSRCASPAGTR